MTTPSRDWLGGNIVYILICGWSWLRYKDGTNVEYNPRVECG